MSFIMVTGGVRSGKSQFAEDLAAKQGASVLYVATGVSTDQEMQRRIRLHQQRRPLGWGLLEASLSLLPTVEHYKDYSAVLVDCLSTWVSNQLLQTADEAIRDPQVEERVECQLIDWLERTHHIESTVILVTNETGLGGVAMSPLGRWFQDVLGLANQLAAQRADEVYLVVAGIPMRIKG
jgi:adenosylcobinamide kinase/adenosylcobinamide-phosphate guanylyltransferase